MRYMERLVLDFKRLGMSRTFAFPEQAFRESQKNAAMARREIFDAVRSNPRIAGYSLTGLLDHGWCGEGLWSYWREWKPETFDVVSEGWARLRFCLFASHNVYDDEPITVEAVLANDGVLHSGTYTAHLAITEKGRPIYTFDQPFTVKEGEFASPIVKLTLPSPLPEGEYELGGQTAYLSGGVAKLADGTIAGAATNLYQGMVNAILFGVPEADAVRAATYNPACALGVQDQVGAIAPGHKADFIICRSDYTGKRVFMDGKEL